MSNIKKISDTEKEVLAKELFSSLCAGITIALPMQKIEKLKLDILNKDGYTEFRPTLFAIIDLCKAGDTTTKRELLAKAYSWLGADYRKQAIYYINLFFEKDINLENREPYPLFKDGIEVWNMDRDSHTCYMKLLDLSKAYEGEHLYQLSLDVLEKAWKLFPYSYTILANKFRVLKKMNKLHDIIEIINHELVEDWTKPFIYKDVLGKETFIDSNRRCLLADMEKYQKLINKGYVYKPRLPK